MMKKIMTALAFMLLASGCDAALAEVKTVQMKIAGYLCGN